MDNEKYEQLKKEFFQRSKDLSDEFQAALDVLEAHRKAYNEEKE